MRLLLSTTFLLLVVGGVFPQSHSCTIRTVRFACPSKYFKEILVGDSETRIFKYREAGSDLYFFMSVPSVAFKPETVGELISKGLPKSLQESFEWKPETDPLVMESNTKYKYKLLASIGLSKTKLLELKAFVFSITGKDVVLGYVSDWSEDPSINRISYEIGKGFGDNAAGCNQVMTALNSVTKEFREREQFCFLTGLASPK